MKLFGKLLLTLPDNSEQAFDLAKNQVSVGRDPACDIPLNDGKVSRTHVLLECGESECFVVDQHSANGTLVNGQPVQRARLAPGDIIRVGNSVLRFEIAPADAGAPVIAIDSLAGLEETVAQETVNMTIYDTSRPRLVVYTPERTWEVTLAKDVLSVGRSPDEDICLPFEKVSRHHALIEQRGEHFALRDLGSTNGTWLGAQAVQEHLLQAGDTLKIGPASLVFKPAFAATDLTLVDEPVLKHASGQLRQPVVFVPGLMGSELWAGNERLWPNVKVLFSTPEVFSLPDKHPLEPRGIVNEVVIVPNLVKQEQYGRLGDFLVESLGYTRGVDLLEFAYDWRQDVRESARKLAAALADWQVGGPIILIAHSLGSLVSRYYIECLGGKNKIERAIFLGGPHYGVTKAVINLVRKADLLPFGMLGERLRQVLTTFPSFYQILPIYNCTFDQRGQPINVFDDEGWLPESGRPMLRAARQFRHELGRRLSIPSVSVFGYGIKTVNRIEVQREANGSWSQVSLNTEGSGDSTIPEASTVLEGSEIHPVEQYHGSLYVDNDVKMRLKLELTGQRRRA